MGDVVRVKPAKESHRVMGRSTIVRLRECCPECGRIATAEVVKNPVRGEGPTNQQGGRCGCIGWDWPRFNLVEATPMSCGHVIRGACAACIESALPDLKPSTLLVDGGARDA